MRVFMFMFVPDINVCMHLQTSNVFNPDGIQHCDSPTLRALNRGRSNRKRAIQHQQNQIKKKLKSISDADRYRERIIVVRRMNQAEASRQAKHLGDILYDTSNPVGIMSLLRGYTPNAEVGENENERVHTLSAKQSSRLLKQANVIRVRACLFAYLFKYNFSHNMFVQCNVGVLPTHVQKYQVPGGQSIVS